jgi:hypothetical protein
MCGLVKMKKTDLFALPAINYNKLGQGIFRDKFYFGRLVFIESQKTNAVIFSDETVLVDYSNIKKVAGGKKVPIGENELLLNGFNYRGDLPGFVPSWSNEGVKSFIDLEKLDGQKLFESIRAELEYYLDVKDTRILDLVTIYILTTYCYSLFNSIGYLFFNSDKESGKTKAMRLTGLMCFNPINATNPSESALFRLCDCIQPTLLIDDFEKIEDEKQPAIMQILKIGYKKDGQTIRTEKIHDKFEPTVFDVYSPKIISNTGGLDSITLSRCIVIRLLKTKTKKGSLEPDAYDPKWQIIRDQCYSFVMQNWKRIRENYLNYKKELFNNRQLELVRGILALAETINPEVALRIGDFLKQSFEDRDLQDISNDWSFLLFSSMLEQVQEKRFYAVSEVSVWCRDKIVLDREGALNKWVGKTLSKIPLFKKRRVGSGVEYLLSQELVKEYMELTGYPIDTTLTTPTTLIRGDEVKELQNPISDTCFSCKQQKFVKYASVKVIGHNYCPECFEESKKLYNFV